MKTCKKGLHQYPKEHNSCKECKKLSNKKWSEQNRERKFLNYRRFYLENKSDINRASSSYYENNKELIKEQRKQYNSIKKPHLRQKSKEWFLKNRYNLTLEELTLMYEKQNHCCAICNKAELNLNNKLHIDHCHVTGKIRGLLCGSCNRALGLLKDDFNICLNAYNYLLKHKD